MVAADAVRVTARFLRDHPTWGLGAVLARMVPEAGDQPPPQEVAIYNEVEDDCVGSSLVPEVLPAVVVIADNQPRTQSKRLRTRLDFDGVEVTFLYFADDISSWTAARQDWSYIAQGLTMSLMALHEPTIGDAAPGWRTRGNFALVELHDLEEIRIGGSTGSRKVVAGLVATLHVRRDLPTT